MLTFCWLAGCCKNTEQGGLQLSLQSQAHLPHDFFFIFIKHIIYFKIIKIVNPRNHKTKVVLIMPAKLVCSSEKKKGYIIPEELKILLSAEVLSYSQNECSNNSRSTCSLVKVEENFLKGFFI